MRAIARAKDWVIILKTLGTEWRARIRVRITLRVWPHPIIDEFQVSGVWLQSCSPETPGIGSGMVFFCVPD